MSAQPGKKAGRTALVTGASGGIGLELARLFARDGHNLVLVARSEGRLEEIATELRKSSGVQVTVIPKDLSHPEAPRQILDELRSAGVHVDYLVNNAGFPVYGPFAENDLAEVLSMIRVNVEALTHLTGLFLPPMVEQQYGRVLNLASVAAFEAGPLMAAYFASKAYVLSFSEAVATELAGTDVKVTALCPGTTNTGFAGRGRMEGSRAFAEGGAMDAGRVARTGYRAMMRGQTVAIVGPTNWLLVQSVRFLPRAFVRPVVQYLLSRT